MRLKLHFYIILFIFHCCPVKMLPLAQSFNGTVIGKALQVSFQTGKTAWYLQLFIFFPFNNSRKKSVNQRFLNERFLGYKRSGLTYITCP